jgi:hypothetical protein
MNGLTQDNYFSIENNQRYMGSSQFKSFMRCEAAALAEVNGQYQTAPTQAMLVGSYVDAYFSNTMEQFKHEHGEIFKKDGFLKSEYVTADSIILRIEKDDLFYRYITGETQKILTGEICGVQCKIKIDSYFPGEKIVDLKVLRDTESAWSDYYQARMGFVENWGYDIQGAFYQLIEGNNLPFILAVATKQDEPDLELYELPESVLHNARQIIYGQIEHFDSIKKGLTEPSRCGKCNYCRKTKVLTGVKQYGVE